MEIVSVQEMRELEQRADMNGLKFAQMMQNAGRAAANVIRVRFPVATPILVLVGPGNNGGDGLVCATTLADAGVDVRCWLLKARDETDNVFAAARLANLAISVGDDAVLEEWLADAALVVDALLGTGVSRPITGKLVDVLAQLRKSVTDTPRPIVALDGPTGMNYDTGVLDPHTVAANLTVTFHAPKRGHYSFPASDACGELVVVPIGIESLHVPDMPDVGSGSKLQLADDALIQSWLPKRTLDGNKGTFGRALVIGGCADYVGAPTLSTRAAYRVGAGLVAYAVPSAIQHTAALLCPEATFVPLPESVESHHPQSLPRIAHWTGGIKEGAAVAMGPGMGQSNDTRDFVFEFMEMARRGEIRCRGLLCDADALNVLSKQPKWHTLLPPNTVLTPHAGEMARLSGMSIDEVLADRIGHALQYAQAWGVVLLLKGAFTVVAAPDSRGIVLPFSNPAMATAGSGDVLSGCIAGVLAQGLAPFEAAVVGAYLHGKAGERWRRHHGDAGMLAGDLLPLLPDVIHELKTAHMI